MDGSPEQDPRVYLAAERTFLAWIRTGLGLMGVGFAVSRFGLFLRQMSAAQPQLSIKTHGISVWGGVGLVSLGVLVNLSAVVNHVRLIRALAAGTWSPGKISRDAVILALLLAGTGLGMAVYLSLVH